MTMTLRQVSDRLRTEIDPDTLWGCAQVLADAIDVHLAGMGEPAAFTTPSMNVVFRPGRYPGNGVDLYTTPPINLAAVRDVIASLRDTGDEYLADKLEAAIKGGV